ncbi:hypothetical protein B0H10DRAFT_2214504 [Mycena sp. CBHHK59/15]|nr:hypothetical protein B0H10DRAFT_2214504 [Mycena sp. CBHHK59/15]
MDEPDGNGGHQEVMAGIGNEGRAQVITEGYTPQAHLSLYLPIRHFVVVPEDQKGSKNKIQHPQAENPSVPKPRGRPRGSGPKQITRVQGIIEPEQTKQPVGHPLKLPPAEELSIRLGNEIKTVRGMPAVIHSKNPPNVTGRYFYPIFNKSVLSASSEAPSIAHSSPAATTTASASSDPTVAPASNTSIPILDEDETDNYSELLNYGLGENDDDYEGIELDEGDDLDPATSTPKNSTGTSEPCPPPHPLPDWFKTQFDAKVKQSMDHDKDGLLALYCQNTF